MKKLFYLMTGILALFIIAGCSSNEKKANKLIDDYMYKHLHDYKSYEAVETEIDTLYNTPISDMTCLQAAALMAMHSEKSDEYEEEADDAERTMDIWSGGWSSTSRNEYKKAARKCFEAKMNQAIENQEVLKNAKIILDKSSELDGKTQVGWLVSHSFRCNNRGGNSMLGTYVFLMDKPFKTILNNFDLDDDDMKDIFDYFDLAKAFGTSEHLDSLIVKYDGTIAKLKEMVDSVK